jgi:hypothetical protein
LIHQFNAEFDFIMRLAAGTATEQVFSNPARFVSRQFAAAIRR